MRELKRIQNANVKDNAIMDSAVAFVLNNRLIGRDFMVNKVKRV